MDVLTPRQADIVALAKSEGRVSVEALADRFNVTPQTIRKDLNDLCERGVLQRYHRGAVLASGIANIGYEASRSLATEEKRRIGLLALLGPGGRVVGALTGEGLPRLVKVERLDDGEFRQDFGANLRLSSLLDGAATN